MRARYFVPGRIELLGKHTDYAGGRSLLVAVDRGFRVAVREAGPAVEVVDVGRGETVRIGLREGRPRPRGGEPPWAVYPRAVVSRVARDFPDRLRGCRIELESDLPPDAGLSSSSALVTGLFLALDAVAGLAETSAYRRAVPDREALAAYLGAVENGRPFPGLGGPADGVGTRGGSEDHVAILCAEKGAAVRYAFEPVRREGVAPLPGGLRLVVAASGVRAAKAGGTRRRYNRLSDLASRAAALWRSEVGGDEPHLGAIVARAGGAEELMHVLRARPEPAERDALVRRVRQFAVESEELVPAATEALAAGELDELGRVVDRSQALAEELLENQVPETIHLARSARALGAVAASAFGAGFGGAVWAMIEGGDGRRFIERWADDYAAAHPDRAADARFFSTPAGAPARALTEPAP